ncbi:MAG TPA: hypothetical protein VHW90_03315 [Stellaceae bacterium]|nr:hypothetical protein [Stellaceae bacterium]
MAYGKSTWVAVGIAAVAVIGVAAVIVPGWIAIGDSDMSAGGWLALILGVVVTLALGIGLMALVFISNRRGYDDAEGS